MSRAADGWQAVEVEQTKESRPEYLTARQLAEQLQVSEATVHRLRRAGRIPAVMLTSRLIRFNLRDVKTALKGRLSEGRDEEADDQGPSPQLSFDDIYADFSR